MYLARLILPVVNIMCAEYYFAAGVAATATTMKIFFNHKMPIDKQYISEGVLRTTLKAKTE